MIISNFVKGCISQAAKRRARYTKAEHQEAININMGWDLSPWSMKRDHILKHAQVRPWDVRRIYRRHGVSGFARG